MHSFNQSGMAWPVRVRSDDGLYRTLSAVTVFPIRVLIVNYNSESRRVLASYLTEQPEVRP
jgi:hypothetical protein